MRLSANLAYYTQLINFVKTNNMGTPKNRNWIFVIVLLFYSGMCLTGQISSRIGYTNAVYDSKAHIKSQISDSITKQYNMPTPTMAAIPKPEYPLYEHVLISESEWVTIREAENDKHCNDWVEGESKMDFPDGLSVFSINYKPITISITTHRICRNTLEFQKKTEIWEIRAIEKTLSPYDSLYNQIKH
jgi:hypothetical protein